MKKNNVAIALSGGVDSAVSALLLKKAGYDLTGVYLKNFDIKSWLSGKKINEKIDSACSSIVDQKHAERVANFLDIPFYVLNLESEYKKYVFSKFIDGYKKGITPNPDVWCNTYIKFGKLLDFCKKIDPESMLATGHYVRLRRTRSKIKDQISNIQIKDNKYHLLRGIDESKDQAYFLWQLTQEQLSKIIFPIGDLLKSQVREIAVKNKLPNALKKDSQGICFVGKLPVKEFLKSVIVPKVGDVVLPNGVKIGEHKGIYFYTIGERINASEIQNGKWKMQNQIQNSKLYSDHRKPLYVIEKNIKNNLLIVDYDEGQKPLWRNEFTVSDIHWISEAPKKDELLDIEIRYHQQPKSVGRILEINNQKSKIINYKKLKIENCELKIRLNESARAVTPGQHVVFYRGNEVLGGAIISR